MAQEPLEPGQPGMTVGCRFTEREVAAIDRLASATAVPRSRIVRLAVQRFIGDDVKPLVAPAVLSAHQRLIEEAQARG